MDIHITLSSSCTKDNFLDYALQLTQSLCPTSVGTSTLLLQTDCETRVVEEIQVFYGGVSFIYPLRSASDLGKEQP